MGCVCGWVGGVTLEMQMQGVTVGAVIHKCYMAGVAHISILVRALLFLSFYLPEELLRITPS